MYTCILQSRFTRRSESATNLIRSHLRAKSHYYIIRPLCLLVTRRGYKGRSGLPIYNVRSLNRRHRQVNVNEKYYVNFQRWWLCEIDFPLYHNDDELLPNYNFIAALDNAQSQDLLQYIKEDIALGIDLGW